jgi:hypothetical protein
MKVFISWSGPRSRRIAETLHHWLPYIIQPVKPFMSSGDIRKGTRWGDVLAQELEETKYGIVCVTQQNMLSPWLNFEAGALSKTLSNAAGHACVSPMVGHACVSPVLFGVEPAKLVGPLSQFQTTEFAEDGKEILGLVRSINQTLPRELRVPCDILECTFHTWWAKLCPAIKKAMQSKSGETEETETGLEWLYSVADFAALEGRGESESVMVINPEPLKDWYLLKETVRANLANGVRYDFIVPCGQLSVLRELIQKEVSQHAGVFDQSKVCIRSMPEEKYNTQAATHYRLLRFKCGKEPHVRVFFEIPVGPCGYWAEASGAAVDNFEMRFNDMAGHANPQPLYASVQPNGLLHPDAVAPKQG